jgi:cytochrome c oxidase assembly factor CtaG
VLALLLPSHSGPDLPGAPLSGSRWLTAWSFHPVPVLTVVISLTIYLYGAHRMRAAGNPWPVARTVAWCHGMLLILLAVASPLDSYDEVLLSVHMIQHMLLAMVAPIFLALGAPVTLALRTLPPAGRRVLLSIVHSRIAQALTFPVVAGAIFIANPFILYFSGYYEQTLRHPWLHDLNHLHFVLVGLLWYVPLLGIDPVRRRPEYPFRVIAAFMTLPFHAWLGVAIMSMNTLIAGDWYTAQHRTWGADPLSDQHTAGGILWTSGDLFGLIVFAVLFVQWMHASEREAKRVDRQLDRRDAEEARRAALNAALARAAAKDAAVSPVASPDA